MSCIHRKALTRYQMLFRHMFYCKHVERQLCSVWISNKTAKQHSLHSAKWCVPAPGAGRALCTHSTDPRHAPAASAAPRLCCMHVGDPRPLQGVEQVAWVQQEARALGTPHADAFASRRFAGAFTLRQRMLNFVQNIQYYMMFEVMEPTWHVLEKNLRSVSSVPLATCLAGFLQSGVREAGPGPHSSQEGRQGSQDAQPGLRLLEEHVLPSEPRRWHPVQGPGALQPKGHVTKLQDQKYSDQCFLLVFCL